MRPNPKDMETSELVAEVAWWTAVRAGGEICTDAARKRYDEVAAELDRRVPRGRAT